MWFPWNKCNGAIYSLDYKESLQYSILFNDSVSFWNLFKTRMEQNGKYLLIKGFTKYVISVHSHKFSTFQKKY